MKLTILPFTIHDMVIREICNACRGDGRMRDETIPCYYCKGKGYIKSSKQEYIKLT